MPTSPSALAYINSVGAVAEELNHHPDIDLRYDTVTLRCSTHYLGGITENDFALAARIDQLDDVEARLGERQLPEREPVIEVLLDRRGRSPSSAFSRSSISLSRCSPAVGTKG